MKISVLRNINQPPEEVDVYEYYELLSIPQLRLQLKELREEGQTQLADSLERRYL